MCVFVMRALATGCVEIWDEVAVSRTCADFSRVEVDEGDAINDFATICSTCSEPGVTALAVTARRPCQASVRRRLAVGRCL